MTDSPTVVFETPGLIDLRAFTVLGVSAKPATQAPIGMFGTGLKYAIAVAVRHGITPAVHIGTTQYTFMKKPSEFRGQPIELLQMRELRPRWKWPRYSELPFTTAYGRYWDLWQVYRELEANTRDEQGHTYVRPPDATPIRTPNCTYIEIIDPAFAEVYANRDEIFLPNASQSLDAKAILEVFPSPSSFLYYRGMRVHELSKPSLRTYNIIRELELTEDRTLRYEFQARQALGDYTRKSLDREFVRLIVTASDNDWEGQIEYNSWQRPATSTTFASVVRAKPRGLQASAQAVIADEEAEELPTPDHPLPWSLVGDWIEDSQGRNIFQKPSGYRGDWTPVAQQVLQAMMPVPDTDPEFAETYEPLSMAKPPTADEVPF